MSRRPPSQPPALPGFDHIRILGSGGFADVFLYQQQHPRRQVAVKVLLKERSDPASAHAFTEEANLMAQLATHPSIVSVYEAGVAADGRPYLVMEYFSKPNLQVRHKRERFSEAEALRIGVQIAAAIETAHRAGILHRDIKPANILVSDYGRPALTDFGISATVESAMSGMSIPWSPPESFRSPPEGYPASDVYSLAATLYTLLTNRSPFELAGASNSEIDVITRIQSLPLPATGRPDISPALESVLNRAMAKDPQQRYSSAIEFARALQHVQIGLGMQPTPIDVIEEELVDAEEDEDDTRTRFRGITSIDAQSQSAPSVDLSSSTPTRAGTPPLPGRGVIPPSVADDTRLAAGPTAAALPTPSPSVRPASGPNLPEPPSLGDTVRRPEIDPDPVPLGPALPKRGVRLGLIAAAGVVLVGIAVGAAVVLAPGDASAPAPSNTAAVPVDAEDGATVSVPQVEDLAGEIGPDGVVFTWTNPEPLDGDVYLWRPVVPGESFAFSDTTTPRAVVAADASGRACIEVVLRRSDGTSALEGVQGCAP